MSSTAAQVAVMPPGGREGSAPRLEAAVAVERPLIRLVAFAALGLYGVLRWGALFSPAPTLRLLGMLAVALGLAAGGPLIEEFATRFGLTERRSRLLATLVGVPLALVALLAMFPLSGMPLSWTVHLRIAVSADWIGQGLTSLPRVLVPYGGVNHWVRVVMLLGAAILLLDAGLLMAFAPRSLGDLRRAGAALPLIALAVVPSTLLRPQLPYLHGLLLFGLLVLFMWGDRIRVDRRAPVLAACGVAGAAAMVLGPAIDPRTPWINPQGLAGSLSPTHVDRFDWSQNYGPLNWPRVGREVLDVTASPGAWPGEYWKTEDLDIFDGIGWVAGGGPPYDAVPHLGPADAARWTQTLEVTIRGMTGTAVIAAGTAQAPTRIASQPLPGPSPGTWVTGGLAPGDSYTVTVYAPHPTAVQLIADGTRYPSVLEPDLTLVLPQPLGGPHRVVFGSFGSRAAPVDRDPPGASGLAAIGNSPYSPALPLVQRLKRGARTPYAYARNVMLYLSSSGFSYDENPPTNAYPLANFLFYTKRGYCQQFAGAMALLLRMGGVPARVATGFTTGTYNNTSKQWVVSDVDAHAWVEAWFPGYGWVSFDPTPASAPARAGHVQIAPFPVGPGGHSTLPHPLRHADPRAAASSGGSATHPGGSSDVALIATLAAVSALLVAAFVVWRRLAPAGPEEVLAELERALARSGRPIANGVTLAGLEHRFGSSREAAAYIRAIRLARFGGLQELPTVRQRRALRAQLRAGLGLGGALRALWALPPRPRGPRPRAGRSRRDSSRPAS